MKSKLPCDKCGVSRYGHIDHDHKGLAAANGNCPFGDCGDYQ